MHRFTSLEQAGAAVAVLSDMDDGDCGWDGLATGDRARFLRRVPVPGETVVALRQVHGTHIERVTGPTDAGDGPLGEGDGIVTDARGVPLAITVADCVPVLLFDPVRHVIAALHAGRAGTAMGMARVGVGRMVTDYGVRPGDIRAVIGPSAGPCCYEVSESLGRECAAQGVVARGCYLDLWETNALQLAGAGVKDAHIEISGCCTICTERFHSYRREGGRARNLAVIMG